MRKLIFVILIIVSVSTYSQKIDIGLHAGFVSASYFNADNSNNVNTSAISSYQIGATSEFKLNQHWYFQTGLSWVEKGSVKARSFIATSGNSTTIKIDYLQLPANMKYKFQLNKDLKGFVGAGFYLSAGISGTDIGNDLVYGTGAIVPVNNKVVFTTNQTPSQNYTSVNPFDFGYNAFAGIEYKHFVVELNYGKGLSKVEVAPIKQYQNQTMGISVGYVWSLKKK